MIRRPLAVAAVALGVAALAALAVSRTSPEPVGGPGPGGESPRAPLADLPDVSWGDPVEVARGEAHQGPWRMNDSDFRYVDAPAASFTGNGEIVVAWVDQAHQDVLLQRYDRAGQEVFPEPVNVSRTPETFSWLPRVVAAGDSPGEVHVLWQEIVFSGGSHGGEAFYARSTDGGESFEEPVNLSGTPAGVGKGRLDARRWDNGSLALERGPDGTLYAAWTEYEGALRVSRSADGGASFEGPIHVGGGNEAPARGPALAVGPGDHEVRVAWTVGEDPAADLRLAHSEDGGRSFGDPDVILPGEGHADAPALAAGPDGTVHLAFAESAGGGRDGYAVRYVRREPGGEGFSEPLTLEDAETGEAAGGASFPSLALDGQGSPHLVWERFPSPGAHPEGLGFARSADGGDSFSRPREVPRAASPELGVNGSRQGLLTRKLEVAQDGTVAVVNSTFDPGRESRVLLVRGETGGDGPQGPDGG